MTDQKKQEFRNKLMQLTSNELIAEVSCSLWACEPTFVRDLEDIYEIAEKYAIELIKKENIPETITDCHGIMGAKASIHIAAKWIQIQKETNGQV